MILKNMHDRLAFRFGRQTGLRLTSDTVDQLQETANCRPDGSALRTGAT